MAQHEANLRGPARDAALPPSLVQTIRIPLICKHEAVPPDYEHDDAEDLNEVRIIAARLGGVARFD